MRVSVWGVLACCLLLFFPLQEGERGGKQAQGPSVEEYGLPSRRRLVVVYPCNLFGVSRLLLNLPHFFRAARLLVVKCFASSVDPSVDPSVVP